MSKKRNVTAMAKANKALSLASQMARSVEKKFAITDIVNNCDNLGSVFELNDVAQGLGDSNRVGDRLTVERVKLNMYRVLPGSATGRFSIRVLVILDKQNLISDCSQVFMNTGSNICPFNQFVKDYRLRFSILYDSLPNHMDQYNKGDTLAWQRRIAIKTQFNAGTTDILSGAVKLIVLANVGSSVAQKPLLIGTVRVDYTDS